MTIQDKAKDIIKKYQNPSGPLTGYDKEIAEYADWIAKGEPKIQRRKEVYDALTSGETPLNPVVAKSMVYSARRNVDDNFAVKWYTQRQKTRPDLVNEDDINYVKDRLSTLKYTTTDSIASKAAAYVANKGVVKGPLANYPDVYKHGIEEYNLENIPPEKSNLVRKTIIDDLKEELPLGIYYPARHILVTNNYKASKQGQYPSELTTLHEETHSYQQPFLEQVANIAKKYRLDPNQYKNQAKEIHARLMTFRKDYNIDPTKTYTSDDIQSLKNQWMQKRDDDGFSGNPENGETYHNHGLLWNYSDGMVLDLLNNVASNDTNKDLNYKFEDMSRNNNFNFAKKGGKLK